MSSSERSWQSADVLRAVDVAADVLTALLERYGLRSIHVPPAEPIPGSYWGECEAGLIGKAVYWRADTPVHSILHEASHAVCMDRQRRIELDRDAGGDFDEENAVCYLQILLSDCLGMGRRRMCLDMDRWGYTFRLGSARAWFEEDAEDARQWLITRALLDEQGEVTWRVRE